MSPYWDQEFEEAASAGAISLPPEHVSLGGSWSSITDTGEATNLNLVSLSFHVPPRARPAFLTLLN
jgi:hypothetical protein